MGAQLHVPPWQSQSTDPSHALASVRYPQVAPSVVQALPLVGGSCGHGVCHTPSRHWQFDPQPTTPPMHGAAFEHAPPSSHLAPEAFEGVHPACDATAITTRPTKSAMRRAMRPTGADRVPGAPVAFYEGFGVRVVPHRAAP